MTSFRVSAVHVARIQLKFVNSMMVVLTTYLAGDISPAICLADPTVLSSYLSAEERNAVHLILLSGQSNMANMDPDRVFTPELDRHFGAENVVVVKVAKKGQPIRRWYKQWNVTGDQNHA
ncbi:MAG: hypothetical protein RJP95_01215, partial [Pirellulales bacterium]